MRTVTAAEQAILEMTDRIGWVRVFVKDADDVFQDLSDYLGHQWIRMVTVKDSIDAAGMSATVQLFIEQDDISISPLREDSQPNNPAGSFQPLIDINRDILIESATTAGPAPQELDWQELFRGRISDWNISGDTIKLQCRDQMDVLMDTFIETQEVYGSATGVTSESVMQSILNDNGFSAITLYTPAASLWILLEYVQQKMPVAEALKTIAQQIGFQLRYRWDNGTSAFRLTYYEPDRAKSAVDWTFNADDYDNVQGLAVKLGGIRNFVKVVYGKAGNRTTVTRQDAASIAKYGRRYMEILESSNSQIDTTTEAGRLADAAVADLSEPDATAQVPVPFFWPIMIEDLYRIGPDGDKFSEDQDLAVVGYEHVFTDKISVTKMTVRGKPSGGYTTWLAREARHPRMPADEIGQTDDRMDQITRYNMQNGLGIGAFHMSGQDPANNNEVANGYFGQQSRITDGSGWPPDGWFATNTGIWGPTDDIYIDTANQLTGGRSIKFTSPTSGGITPELSGKFLPVQEGGVYVGSWTMKISAAGASNVWFAFVDWYQSDKSTLISSQQIGDSVNASVNWLRGRLFYRVAPTNARWARIRLVQTNFDLINQRIFYIDNVQFSRSRPYFSVYRNSNQAIPSMIYTTILYDTLQEGNESTWYATGTGYFTAPEPGLYLFIARGYWGSGLSNPAMRTVIRLQLSTTGGASWVAKEYDLRGLTAQTLNLNVCPGMFRMDAGDIVRARAWTNDPSGANLTPGIGLTAFEGHLLQAAL